MITKIALFTLLLIFDRYIIHLKPQNYILKRTKSLKCPSLFTPKELPVLFSPEKAMHQPQICIHLKSNNSQPTLVAPIFLLCLPSCGFSTT